MLGVAAELWGYYLLFPASGSTHNPKAEYVSGLQVRVLGCRVSTRNQSLLSALLSAFLSVSLGIRICMVSLCLCLCLCLSVSLSLCLSVSLSLSLSLSRSLSLSLSMTLSLSLLLCPLHDDSQLLLHVHVRVAHGHLHRSSETSIFHKALCISVLCCFGWLKLGVPQLCREFTARVLDQAFESGFFSNAFRKGDICMMNVQGLSKDSISCCSFCGSKNCSS